MAGIFREHVVKRFFEKRSSKWPKTRKTYLLENPHCANCGKKKKFGMQVHHIIPFHVDPTLELVPSNLLTLCDNPRCHLDKGHLGYFRSWNVNVVRDCAQWRKKYRTRPLKEKH